MSEINLGKVMLSWQGEYDNAKTYTRLDAVSYNGSSYISLNGSVGVLPTNTEYWGKLAQAGKDGSAATAQTPDLSQIKSDVASNSTAVASAASTANAASAAASQANQAVQAIDLSPLEQNITANSTAASSAYALASSAMSEIQRKASGGATINTDILNANDDDKTPDKYKDGFTYEMRYASKIGITMSDYVLNPPTVIVGLLTTKTYKLSAMQLAHQTYEVSATNEPYVFMRIGTTTKTSDKTISKWTDWVLVKTSNKLSNADRFGGTINS